MSTPEAAPQAPSTDPIPWALHYEEALLSSQTGASAWTRAGQHFMRGVMAATLHQLELGQHMIGDALTDLKALQHAKGPDDFVRAELDIAGKQTERFISAARTLNDELRTSYFDAVTLALGDGAEEHRRHPRHRAS
jgi:hypothetical protein